MEQPSAIEKAIAIDPNYGDRTGYNPAFLGTGIRRVSLPALLPALRANAAEFVPGPRKRKTCVLKYHHYSAVMNGARRLAYFTAVNIDGKAFQDVSRDSDRWSFDPRIDRSSQIGAELYGDNDLDFGHLVRRLDTAWGSTPQVARIANDDTFHLTNCAPQHKLFNRNKSTWAGLEDYILSNAIATNLKVSVFTGPVFSDGDPEYRGVKLPQQYWKVVAILKQGGGLSATAYLLDQSKLVQDLEEKSFSFGAYKTFQVSVRQIEALTGLSFGKLKSFDPLDGVKTLLPRELASPADIQW